MLQFIRSKVTTIFAKILFVLLIASFAVWGIGDTIFGNPAGRTAVQVDDIRITAVEAASEFDAARRQLGVPITVDQALQFGLLEQVMDNLAVEGMLVAATSRLGLSAGDAQVVTLIRDRFRDSLGQFDRIAYETFLAANGFTEEEFVARTRRDLARNQLLAAVVTDAEQTVPGPLVDLLHRHREERRIVDAVRIEADAVDAPAAPAEADLLSYYEERADDYETPEYRGLSWLEVSPASIAAGIEIAEDGLLEAFEERRDSLSTAGTRTVDQILFDDEATARQAYDRIRGGEDYVAIAAEFTGLGEADLDLGEVTRDSLPAGTASGVFAVTEPGGVSEPLASDFGWHLFRIREAVAGQQAQFDDVREQLRQELALEEAYDLVFERANNIEDALAGGATLEETALELSLSLNQVPFVARDGQQKDGGITVTLPGEPFLQTAFQTEPGAQSTLSETRDGTFFILRVDGVEEPRLPDLSEIRGTVLADWTADRRLEMAEDIAEQIADRVSGGTPLSVAASDAGLNVERLPAFTRRGQGLPAGWSPALSGVVFDLSVGEAGTIGDDTGAVAAALVEVLAGGGDMAGPKDAVNGEIVAATSSDLVELLLADLRARHEVSVDPEAVRQLFTLDHQGM